jgi:hypothetical protein
MDPGGARDRRRFFWLAFLVAFWALEVLAVQECTSQPDGVIYASDAVGFATRRLGFDVLASIFLVCVLNRFWLYVVFGVGLIASNILIVYAEYFEAPLTWHVIRHQWAEGLAVADHGMSLIQWPALVLLLAALAIKVALRERFRRHLGPRPGLRRLGWAAGVAYLVFAIWLAGVHKPISKIRSGSPEYVYGYVIAWFAEGTFFDDARLLRMAIEASQQRSDRLSPWESPLELGDRLAIVQVESLDWDVIDARVGDEWVMPFLRDLRTRSMCYVIRPVHETGTSDADFTVLTGTMANGRIAPFKIEDFPYQNTLPQVARQRGYSCIAMHGNTGNFFFRRPAYEQMGFSKIYFAEDLRDLGCEMHNGEVNDERLLRLSAEWLREASGPTVHFIITVTSHGPFHRLLPEDRELFPKPSCQAEAYLNSMRYVDRVLASYLEALPQGTVLVVYGDHESRVRGYGETPHTGERVPWLIHRKGQNLAERQRTRDMPWTQSGELQMLDAVTYLHKSLKEYQVAAHKPPSAGSDAVR